VFFPPGTYRRTTAMVPPANVHLLGAGAGVSIITIDHATRNAITLSNATTGDVWQTIRGLSIKPVQSHSGAMIYFDAAVYLRLMDCVLGDATYTVQCITATSSGATSSMMDLDGCSFLVNDSVDSGIKSTKAAISMRGCVFYLPPAPGALVAMVNATAGISADACVFRNDLVTGSVPIYDINFLGTAHPNTIVACEFMASGGAATPFAFVSSAPTNFSEVGNHFGVGVTAYSFTPSVSTTADCHGPFLGTRESRKEHLTDATDVTVHARTYRTSEWARVDSTGARTCTVEGPWMAGESFDLFIRCGHASGISSTVIAGVTGCTSVGAMSSGNIFLLRCVSADIAGSLAWYAASVPTTF
jgi:hypothetical protein